MYGSAISVNESTPTPGMDSHTSVRRRIVKLARLISPSASKPAPAGAASGSAYRSTIRTAGGTEALGAV